jgi:hypothetical protein
MDNLENSGSSGCRCWGWPPYSGSRRRPTTTARRTLASTRYSGQKVQTQDPLWVDRIEQAVNADLTAEGWTQVPSGGKVTEWLSGDFGEAERILRSE